jgi:hypothetical protein
MSAAGAKLNAHRIDLDPVEWMRVLLLPGGRLAVFVGHGLTWQSFTFDEGDGRLPPLEIAAGIARITADLRARASSEKARSDLDANDAVIFRSIVKAFLGLSAAEQIVTSKFLPPELLPLMGRAKTIACAHCNGSGCEPNDTGNSVFDGDPCTACRSETDDA